MSRSAGRFSVPIIMTALVLAACGGDKGKSDSALASDSTLHRDLAMAGRDTAAQPALTDVPANSGTTKGTTGGTKSTTKTATKSTTKTTTTKTASGNTKTSGTGMAAKTGEIASGTSLSLRANAKTCTNTNKVGDKITASVNEAVAGTNGVSIPAGSEVTLTVTRLKRSENVNDPIVMEFQVNSVTVNGKTYPVEATVQSAAVTKVRNEPKSADAKKVIGGAAIGAIAGQVLGKNTKSTVIGAAAGAAAGAGVAAATANYEGCINPGATIVVQLTGPITMSI